MTISREVELTWVALCCGLLGLLAGLRLRAAAMLVASAGVVAIAALAAILGRASAGSVAVLTIGSLFAFQATYLVGVALSVLWSRRQDTKRRDGTGTHL